MIEEFEKYRALIEALPNKTVYERADLITDQFLLFSDGKLSAYYAPFHYMNRNARVVLVGLTPGWTQMECAFRTAKQAMSKGLTGDDLFHCIEKTASFSGPLRKNLVSMLDGIGLNQHLKLPSCDELFSSASGLVHFTSAVSTPVFRSGENFTGHGASLLKLPKFHAFILNNLAQELAALPNAILIPLGKIVDEIIAFLGEKDLIDPGRCLNGFPHPSGQNGHRKRLYSEGQQQWRKQLLGWSSGQIPVCGILDISATSRAG